MAIVEEGSGDIPEIEDGSYTLTVVSAVVGIREGPDKFNPEIIDAQIVHINTAVQGTDNGEGGPIVLRSTMNLKFSRPGIYDASTLFLFAQGFGALPPVGLPFDTDALVGKSALGTVKTPKGKWPKVSADSLVPVKGAALKAPSAPVETADVPWEAKGDVMTEAEALGSWMEGIRLIGYTTKEILDHAKSSTGKALKDLSAAERDTLAAGMKG